MIILDGKKARDARTEALRERIAALDTPPHLVIVQAGDLESSNAYIRQKVLFGGKLGAAVTHRKFSETISTDELVSEIGRLNADPAVHGIIVQLPLPDPLDSYRIIESIAAEKDVDGLTSKNVKLVMSEKTEGFIPATARGILSLLDFYGIPCAGKDAVVVGRSNLVGMPAAIALLNRDATVTICHTSTTDLAAHTRQADILVVAAGKPKLITAAHVCEGQSVIDVGITAIEENGVRKLTGDVDFDAVKDIVGAITPVPGGVGPMTVVSLFENLVAGCAARLNA